MSVDWDWEIEFLQVWQFVIYSSGVEELSLYKSDQKGVSWNNAMNYLYILGLLFNGKFNSLNCFWKIAAISIL